MPGSLYGWGYNYVGQLGDGSELNKISPTEAASLGTWKKISANSARCHAIRSDDTLWGWGWPGGLGDGTTEARTTPVKTGSDSWIEVAAGAHHCIAIRSDNTLWGWGSNSFGQNGTSAERLSPFLIASGSWSKVAAGGYVSYAIRSDGTLWTWGMSMGIGLSGPNAYVGFPTKIGSATWVKISTNGQGAGGGHVLGIQSDGTLWSWGDNGQGQLGDGTQIDHDTPAKVGSSTWLDISAGNDHSLAIKSDGTLHAWGGNGYGQIGNGQNPGQLGMALSVTSPTKIGSSTWNSVSAGHNFSLAILSDGTLWSWGTNTSNSYTGIDTPENPDAGKLGDGTKVEYRSSPGQAGSFKWSMVSAGEDFSVGIIA